MNKIVCLRCGSENNDDYKFCINCGATLPKKYGEPFEEKVKTEENHTSDTSEPLKFDGVSSYEMSLYIGKNADKILPKMQNMKKFNQKVSFCFPVFILGLFFSFFGISMWFFYRKMKKIGSIFLFLGIALSLGDIIVNLDAISQLFSGYFSVFKDLALSSGDMNQNFAINALENLLNQYNSSYVGIFSFISEYVGGLICPVLMGMFGLHFYKEKAVLDIKKIKEVAPTEYVLGEISMKGGTSGSLLSVPIIFNLLTALISFVLVLISL